MLSGMAWRVFPVSLIKLCCSITVSSYRGSILLSSLGCHCHPALLLRFWCSFAPLKVCRAKSLFAHYNVITFVFYRERKIVPTIVFLYALWWIWKLTKLGSSGPKRNQRLVGYIIPGDWRHKQMVTAVTLLVGPTNMCMMMITLFA